MQPVIWAIVPAHNEESIIEQTIKDLVAQTLPVKILVVFDNCTDNTQKIVQNLIPYYRNLYSFKTKYNNKKKAGAINQAIESLHVNEEFDAILVMDADTRIDINAVEFGWKKLKSDPKIAAVCSKAGVLPYKGTKFFEWVLYLLQRLEYSDFDSQRIETLGAVKVVHGMAAIHRWSSLKEVGGFDDNNLVEDYDLTIKYKEVGYKTTVELKMKAWTEVPVVLKEWWTQRLRWSRGGLDTLKKHGWNNITKKYILQHIFTNILLLFQWVFLLAFLVMILNGSLIMHGYVLVVTIFSVLCSMYRLKYLEERNFFHYCFRMAIFPEMLYGILQSLNQYHAYYNFFLNKKQSW